MNSNGYGRMSFNSYPEPVHRVSWVLANGPIPDGLSVLHRCDVPRCVNPDHLFLGTQTENNADRDSKQRMVHGERVHTAILSEADVLEIMGLRAEGVSYNRLAKRYGVSFSTIRDIARGRSWKHLQNQDAA